MASFTNSPDTLTLPITLSGTCTVGATGGFPACIGSFDATLTDGTGTTYSPRCIEIGNTASQIYSESVTCPVTFPPLGPGDTATIGFWHNKNGQAVIEALNGSASSTALATWLATNFPHLFGKLAGDTNTEVAAAYETAFGNVGGVQRNTYAQVFSTALASYATSTTLAGSDPLAGHFGFNTSPGGTGAKSYNVGSDGAAAGVANGTSLTVAQLLAIANMNYNSTTGLFYAGNQALTSMLNDIFNGINQGGDI
jgi:hypothetical protein